MEYKRVEDEHLHKIIIAAAATIAMACLKRVLVMFFVEQWRARVFLVLNLVLVAIFVTSIRSIPTENEEINGNNNAENTIKDQEKKRRKECGNFTRDEGSKKSHVGSQEEKDGIEKGSEEEVQIKNGDLSEEELNERVEAFIAMFRQHLARDAKRGKNHFISRTKQAEMLNFHEGSKFTNSSSVPHRHSFCI